MEDLVLGRVLSTSTQSAEREPRSPFRTSAPQPGKRPLKRASITHLLVFEVHGLASHSRGKVVLVQLLWQRAVPYAADVLNAHNLYVAKVCEEHGDRVTIDLLDLCVIPTAILLVQRFAGLANAERYRRHGGGGINDLLLLLLRRRRL